MSTQRVVRSLRRSYHLVRRAGGSLVAATAIIGIVASSAVAAELLLVRRIVDDFDAGRSAVSALAALAGLAALRRLFATIGTEAQWLVAERVEKSVLDEVLEVAGRAPFADFEQPEFQDALSRATLAGQRDVWGAAWGLFQLLTSFTTIVALVAILASTSSVLLIPFAVAAVGLGFVAVVKSRMSYSLDYHDTEPDRERRYLRQALVSRSEGREMRLFNTGTQLRRRHADLFDRRLEQLRTLIGRRIAAEGLSSLGLGIVLAFVLVLIGRAVENDDITLSSAAVAAVAAHQLAGSQSRLFSGLANVLEATLHVGDLDDFVARDYPPATTPAVGAPERIELRDVTFRYPGASVDALSGIDLDLARGSLVAVVGENGSGKTTLGRLMLGLYQPTSGRTELVGDDGERRPIDGPLEDIATASFQDFARYELSVAENIALGGASEPDPERIDQLLATTGLDGRIADLPNGVDTLLGRRFVGGQDLSIGQWQRLALARAAYNRRSSFVVLDEPSASLDPDMEAALFDRLRDLYPHQGVLLISHRLASLHRADQIIVMHQGRIAEQGTHRELVASAGIYAALYRQQVQRLGADREQDDREENDS